MDEARLGSTYKLLCQYVMVLSLCIVAGTMTALPGTCVWIQSKAAGQDATPQNTQFTKAAEAVELRKTDLDPLPPGALVRMGTSRQRHSGEVKSKCFSPDGKVLALGGTDGMVRLWDVATGKEIRSWKAAGNDPQKGENGWLRVAFSPDGKVLAAIGNLSDDDIWLWDVATGKEIRSTKEILRSTKEILFGDRAKVNFVCFSPDGQLLASRGEDRIVRLWQTSTGKEIRHWLEFEYPVGCLCFSSDSKILVSGGCGSLVRNDNAVRLYDLAADKMTRLHTIGHQGDVNSVSFSTDGNVLASVGGGTFSRRNGFSTVQFLDVLDVTTGNAIRSWPLVKDIEVACFSADGKILAGWDGKVKEDEKVWIWDVATGKKIRSWKKDSEICSGSLSSDGKTLATRPHGAVQLWETSSGQKRLSIPLKEETWTGVSLSPDGRLLASVEGKDQMVQMWDAISGRLLHQFPTDQKSAINSLAFAPNSKSLAVANADTTILIWDLTPYAGRKNGAKAVPPAELKASLSTLATANAAKAYQALGKLVAASDQAVPLLAEWLQPTLADTAFDRRMTQLLADLDNDDFQVRIRTREELEKMAVTAESFLRHALNDKLSVEAHSRVEELLDKINAKENEVSPRQLSLFRCVEVLERIGTPVARQALQKVVETWPRNQVGDEARSTLQRLSRRLP